MGMPIEFDLAVYSGLCKEPEGEFLRSVKPFIYTPENVEKLWSKVKQFPTFMGQPVHEIQDMLNILAWVEKDGTFTPKGILYIIDDFVGVFFVNEIRYPVEAMVHYTFFDRRHKGRLEFCRGGLKYLLDTYQLHRLYTQVPAYAVQVKFFIEQLGLKKEGKLRENTVFKGRFYDTYIYGILKEELNGIRR